MEIGNGWSVKVNMDTHFDILIKKHQDACFWYLLSTTQKSGGGEYIYLIS